MKELIKILIASIIFLMGMFISLILIKNQYLQAVGFIATLAVINVFAITTSNN